MPSVGSYAVPNLEGSRKVQMVQVPETSFNQLRSSANRKVSSTGLLRRSLVVELHGIPWAWEAFCRAGRPGTPDLAVWRSLGGSVALDGTEPTTECRWKGSSKKSFPNLEIWFGLQQAQLQCLLDLWQLCSALTQELQRHQRAPPACRMWCPVPNIANRAHRLDSPRM